MLLFLGVVTEAIAAQVARSRETPKLVVMGQLPLEVQTQAEIEEHFPNLAVKQPLLLHLGVEHLKFQYVRIAAQTPVAQVFEVIPNPNIPVAFDDEV